MTGRTISQYQILEKLGKSGMGEAKQVPITPVVVSYPPIRLLTTAR